MLTKAVSLLTVFLLALIPGASASDTLIVIFDRQNFLTGDSIEMEVYSEPYRKDLPPQTLHLWIDDVKTGRRWKYRYPFIKGRCKMALKINESIPGAVYAFNFLVQEQFLAIKGKVVNEAAAEKTINYIARARNKAPIIDGVELEEGGRFTIDHLYFTDSAFFGFTPPQRKKENKLRIGIETPIDSVFEPAAISTEMITIGKADQTIVPAAGETYSFSMLRKMDKELLEEVVLQSTQSAKRKKYEAANVSGLFAGDDAVTFDFYENNELENYGDVFSFLTAKMPGLRTETSPETGQPVLYWRRDKTDIFIDEFADTDFSPYSISIQNIEMIKVYRPGTRMGLEGSGGTVAIYTKRFSNRAGNKLSNYSFVVKGFTPAKSEWK